MTTTDPQPTPDDALTARQARRTALRDLITRVGRGRAGADIGTLLRVHLDAEFADADEAHAEAAATRDGIGQIRDQHEAHRTALSEALGLGTGAPWDAIVERTATVKAAADERAGLLAEARDALEAAGQTGAHGDDWPAIAPAIRELAADLDLRRGNSEVDRREASHRREALAAVLQLPLRAGWDAIRTATEETVRRAKQAEAAIIRVRAELDRIAALPTTTRDDDPADSFGTGARWTLRMIRATLSGRMRCVCGDPIQLMDDDDPASWIHSPGSDTRCLDARPVAALDGEQPTEPEPEADAEPPCFHPSWETEPTLGARRCTDCGEWLDPQPPAPDGAALWATIRQHAAADTAFWAQPTRRLAPNPRA